MLGFLLAGLMIAPNVYADVHAGARTSLATPYTYGYGLTITFGRKPEVSYHLYDKPSVYNYFFKCPPGNFPGLNKRTTTWTCYYD